MRKIIELDMITMEVVFSSVRSEAGTSGTPPVHGYIDIEEVYLGGIDILQLLSEKTLMQIRDEL